MWCVVTLFNSFLTRRTLSSRAKYFLFLFLNPCSLAQLQSLGEPGGVAQSTALENP